MVYFRKETVIPELGYEMEKGVKRKRMITVWVNVSKHNLENDNDIIIISLGVKDNKELKCTETTEHKLGEVMVVKTF